MAGWAYLDWPRPIAFAHRGGAGEHPENTMVAFAAAMALGYTYLETDVHVTRDGALVAFHDHDLDRVTDRSGPLCKLSLAELRRATVSGEPIPLLEDILGTWPRARVNIDAKHDACVPALAAAVQRTNAHDRVGLGAFSTKRVDRLRRLTGGRVCTWAGTADIVRLRLASLGVPVAPGAVGCAQVPARRGRVTVVDERLVRTAHARGLAVHVWTVNDPLEMARLLDLGVDGIMSDYPSVLRSVFVERGVWL